MSVVSFALIVLSSMSNARAQDDPSVEEPVPVEAWNWRAAPPPAPPVISSSATEKDEGKPLKIAGYAMLGAGYVISAWVGLMIYVVNDDVEPSEDSDDVDRDEFWYLFIPVGGSLAYGISRGREISTKDHLEELGQFVGFILTIPTLVQSVGLCLAVAGHSKKEKVEKRRVSFLATPIVGPDGSVGVGFSGGF